MNLPPSFLDHWQYNMIFPSDKIHPNHQMSSDHSAADTFESVERKLSLFHLKALKETITHAKSNTLFYRKHLNKIRVEEIRSLEQFSTLPFTFPLHIQENSLSFLSVSQDEISRIVTLQTSGTTGISKRIFFTSPDLERTIDFFSLVMSKLTKPLERVLILLPGSTPASAGDLLKTAMGRIGVKGVVHGLITDFNKAINAIESHTPSAIIGMPVQILALCELLREKKIKDGSIRSVILTSDHASAALKERVGNTVGCEVFDHYGMTETAFGCAIDCSAHRGYHLRELDLFVEIVDPETGEAVLPGQWGEITVTTLTREGMPLVRYRTGDISRFISAPCPCRSSFRLMDYIRQRYSHTILLPGGQRLGMADLDDLLFTIPGVVDFDAAIVSKGGEAHLEIVVKLIKRALISNIDIEMEIRKRLHLSPALKRAVETRAVRFGLIRIELFRFVDTYSGKRRICDHLDKEKSA